jgi:hypothetical protein
VSLLDLAAAKIVRRGTDAQDLLPDQPFAPVPGIPGTPGVGGGRGPPGPPGPQNLFIQVLQPTAPPPWLWIQIDALGNLVSFWVNT